MNLDLPSPAAHRIRVLEVVGNGIVGGMESVVLRLVDGLPRERFQIFALCPYEGAFSARLRERGVACQAVPMPDDPPWSAIQTVCALVQSLQIDVLHAHLANAHLLAGIVGRLTGRPVLATVHGRQMTLADLEVHRAAGTHLCTVCRHSELHAIGLGVDPRRLSCIPNGVDTSVFAPRADDGDGDAADRRFTVGFVGRLSPEKGPELFIRAALLLHDVLPGARFVLFGDGPLRPALRALLDAHGASARIELAGVRDDMPDAYREIDVLVSTSHSEAMPLAVMEAMASALPVVATRVGGVPDLVEHGATGWLVDPGHVDAIVAHVTQLHADPDLRRTMGRRGRQRMVDRYTLTASLQATGQLLARLADPPGAEAPRIEVPRRPPAVRPKSGAIAAREPALALAPLRDPG